MGFFTAPATFFLHHGYHVIRLYKLGFFTVSATFYLHHGYHGIRLCKLGFSTVSAMFFLHHGYQVIRPSELGALINNLHATLLFIFLFYHAFELLVT